MLTSTLSHIRARKPKQSNFFTSAHYFQWLILLKKFCRQHILSNISSAFVKTVFMFLYIAQCQRKIKVNRTRAADMYLCVNRGLLKYLVFKLPSALSSLGIISNLFKIMCFRIYLTENFNHLKFW